MAPTSAGADDNGKRQIRVLNTTIEHVARSGKLTNRRDFDDCVAEAMRLYDREYAVPPSDFEKPGRAESCAS